MPNLLHSEGENYVLISGCHITARSRRGNKCHNESSRNSGRDGPSFPPYWSRGSANFTSSTVPGSHREPHQTFTQRSKFQTSQRRGVALCHPVTSAKQNLPSLIKTSQSYTMPGCESASHLYPNNERLSMNPRPHHRIKAQNSIVVPSTPPRGGPRGARSPPSPDFAPAGSSREGSFP